MKRDVAIDLSRGLFFGDFMDVVQHPGEEITYISYYISYYI